MLSPSVFAETTAYESIISNAIYQVKIVLIKKSSSEDIENIINHGRDEGIKGYKINHYANDQMGWSVLDSKGTETFSVIFSFIGSKASKATYYGPLMLYSDAIEIHKLHNQVLVNNFKQIGSDRFDIGDNCIALVELFKSKTSEGGRTTIAIKCY